MHNSEILYINLLKFGSKRILDYLKNVSIFDSQFKYSRLNESCYEQMYLKLYRSDGYQIRKSFFGNITDLKTECNKCWKYFLNPRNRMEKGYDVQLGKQLEEIFTEYMKTIGIKIIRGDLKNRKYPDLVILDNSKAIIGYIEFKYHAAPFVWAFKKMPNRECYEGSVTLDKDKIIEQLKIIYSELERPVFYVHWVDFPCIKGIFFQTSEQLHDMLQNNIDEYIRKEREGDYIETKDGNKRLASYLGKFYPSITGMGTFEELLKIIKNNKKNIFLYTVPEVGQEIGTA